MTSDAMMTAAVEAMLAAYTAGLTTPKIGLFKNPVTPTPANVLADLVQPTGTWYVTVAAVFARPIINTDGSVTIHTQAVQFDYTGASAEEQINGWMIFHNTNVLVSARKFAAPVTMSGLFTSVRAWPSITLPPMPQI